MDKHLQAVSSAVREEISVVRMRSVEYGDYAKYLNAAFLGNVARDNAEALRQLTLAPLPPTEVHLAGGVTQDAKISWSANEDDARAGFEIFSNARKCDPHDSFSRRIDGCRNRPAKIGVG